MLPYSNCVDCKHFIGFYAKHCGEEADVPLCSKYPRGIDVALYIWMADHSKPPKQAEACSFSRVTEKSRDERDAANKERPLAERDPAAAIRLKEMYDLLVARNDDENVRYKMDSGCIYEFYVLDTGELMLLKQIREGSV